MDEYGNLDREYGVLQRGYEDADREWKRDGESHSALEVTYRDLDRRWKSLMDSYKRLDGEYHERKRQERFLQLGLDKNGVKW